MQAKQKIYVADVTTICVTSYEVTSHFWRHVRSRPRRRQRWICHICAHITYSGNIKHFT